MSANPILEHVPGSPVQPKQIVRVVAAIDEYVYDVSGHIGRLGIVEYLDYGGCGQTYPSDPMIGVKLGKGFAAWTGTGWADGEDRVLLTEREFRRFAIQMFVGGMATVSLLAFELGRLSVAHHWF